MPSKPALTKQSAGFIETMDCLPVSKLPEGPMWTYEILCDGQHKISYVVKVIMWCWIILAATFASELVLRRNIIWNLLNTLNSATHYSPILASEYTRLLPPGTAI